MGRIIPYIMEKKNVPNHQPVKKKNIYTYAYITLWQSYMAMDNSPFIVDFPMGISFYRCFSIDHVWLPEGLFPNHLQPL